MSSMSDESTIRPSWVDDHVWVRLMIMPVDVILDDDGVGAVIVNRKSAIQKLVDEGDQRVGCLVCNSSLDSGWGHPCPGPDTENLEEEFRPNGGA